MKQTESIKTRMTITKHWKAKIEEKGLSIAKLSRLAGVDRATIYYALNGDRLPRFSTVNKIEEVLNGDELGIPNEAKDK